MFASLVSQPVNSDVAPQATVSSRPSSNHRQTDSTSGSSTKASTELVLSAARRGDDRIILYLYCRRWWVGLLLTGCLQLWNLSIVENSGNLKYTPGIFVYQMLFFVTQCETHNKPTCKFARLQWYLCELLVVVYQILVDDNFRRWNCGRTPIFTFITQHRLSLQTAVRVR